MKEYDKRESHTSNKIHVNCMSSNNVGNHVDKMYDFVTKSGRV